MQNRIIIPANYTVEVILKYDPVNGQTELNVRNRSKIQVSMWQVVGLLTEHSASLVRSLLAGKVEMKPAAEQPQTEVKTNGGDNNAT